MDGVRWRLHPSIQCASGSKLSLCRTLPSANSNHPVAEPVGLAFAAPRQLDDSCRDGIPSRHSMARYAFGHL
jgi:hypothetical protein